MIQELRFNSLRNARYHSMRKDFLYSLRSRLAFAMASIGFATICLAAAQMTGAAVATAFAVTMLIVVTAWRDPTAEMQKHRELAQKFYAIAGDVEMLGDSLSDDKASEIKGQIMKLYSDEPHEMRALNAIAYNIAVDSLGCDPGQRLRVTWWQRAMKNLCRFDGAHFQPVGEV